jgi:hypothetical protein
MDVEKLHKAIGSMSEALKESGYHQNNLDRCYGIADITIWQMDLLMKPPHL